MPLVPTRKASPATERLASVSRREKDDVRHCLRTCVVKNFGPEKIMQLSSGQQRSIAPNEKGTVHVWGYNGCCRLGQGNQVDALRPKKTPHFTGDNAGVLVIADKGGMYWMTGQWNNFGYE
ncbi:uncharacterized protein EV420DRAFT_1652026 [Desarmillaria tabescens]|uniref:RCC1/BLIP-II n=1 Tax=Armillaria tabescens TaxID=1929756 RepID=A0AA39MKV1_ARMTA|nr:uncharacterized protein EV420DRAFT_1652026 [Desarmillaria tabescens]KAK0437434.1 hypothetical protein EV420DRAFT_1652026 [Desarmillaria tabescens]